MQTASGHPLNEEALKSQVKVLVEGSTYHWRDASDRTLCNQRQEGELTPLLEIPALTFLCGLCRKTVDAMSKGWGLAH